MTSYRRRRDSAYKPFCKQAHRSDEMHTWPNHHPMEMTCSPIRLKGSSQQLKCEQKLRFVLGSVCCSDDGTRTDGDGLLPSLVAPEPVRRMRAARKSFTVSLGPLLFEYKWLLESCADVPLEGVPKARLRFDRMPPSK